MGCAFCNYYMVLVQNVEKKINMIVFYQKGIIMVMCGWVLELLVLFMVWVQDLALFYVWERGVSWFFGVVFWFFVFQMQGFWLVLVFVASFFFLVFCCLVFLFFVVGYIIQVFFVVWVFFQGSFFYLFKLEEILVIFYYSIRFCFYDGIYLFFEGFFSIRFFVFM